MLDGEKQRYAGSSFHCYRQAQSAAMDPETGRLTITFTRHRKNSALGPAPVTPGGEFTFGNKLPDGTESPWKYEEHRRFVDVYQFPDGQYRLVQTNLSGHYAGKHVRVELGHYRKGDEVIPTRDVFLDSQLQFCGRFAQQMGNLIRIVDIDEFQR